VEGVMRRFWIPLGVSVALTPILLIIALGSEGVGHADDKLFLFLFPVASIVTIVLDPLFDSTALLIGLAMLQFPCYGFVFGIAAKRQKNVPLVGSGILVLHVVIIAMAFWLSR
jgi:hypothetical protein